MACVTTLNTLRYFILLFLIDLFITVGLRSYDYYISVLTETFLRRVQFQLSTVFWGGGGGSKLYFFFLFQHYI